MVITLFHHSLNKKLKQIFLLVCKCVDIKEVYSECVCCPRTSDQNCHPLHVWTCHAAAVYRKHHGRSALDAGAECLDCRSREPVDTCPAHRAGGLLLEVYPTQLRGVSEMALYEAVLDARVLLPDDCFVVVGASLDVVLLAEVTAVAVHATVGVG